jgi:hypothetical protein
MQRSAGSVIKVGYDFQCVDSQTRRTLEEVQFDDLREAGVHGKVTPRQGEDWGKSSEQLRVNMHMDSARMSKMIWRVDANR